MRAIRALGMMVAPAKCEAIFVHDASHGKPPQSSLTIEDTRIPIAAMVKYLGFITDS